MIFDRLADAIAKHAKLIVVMWVIILICSVPLAMKSSEVMKYDINEIAAENSESVRGMEIMDRYFPSGGGTVSSMPIILIKYDDEAGEAAGDAFINYMNDHSSEYTDKDGNPKLRSNAFVSMGSQTKEGLEGGIILAGVLFSGEPADEDVDTLREFISGMEKEFAALGPAQAEILSDGVYLTGTLAVTHDLAVGALEDVSRIDPFTVLMILILVGLFFRSFITSATPPVTIGVAFVVVLALIYGIGQILSIFFITEMLLLVSMMGAGCDYCIFIISRYREGLRSGLTHELALHDAIKWAGESIATSGASVVIGFGVMSICSISMISTMGICLALSILVAMLAALTLIPAILQFVRDRIFWPTTMKAFEEGGKATRGWFAWFGRLGEKYFEKSSRFSLKRAGVITLAAVLVTVPAAYLTMNSETSYDMISCMQTGDSGKGMEYLGEYANQGMFMPNYIIFETSEPIAHVYDNKLIPEMKMLIWSDSFKDINMDPYYNALRSDPNVADVAGPYMWDKYVQEAEKQLTEEGAPLPLSYSDIVDRAVENTPEMLKLYLEPVVTQVRGMMSDEQLVLMGGSSIDYLINNYSKMIGGDYVESGTGDVNFFMFQYSTADAAMSPLSMQTIDHSASETDAFVKTLNAVRGTGYVTETWVTGTAAVMYDISKDVSEEFNLIEVLVIIFIIILLFVVMRSYLIPLRSVFTILMSISWTLAMTHVVFTVLLGKDVIWLIPLILLVICLGLGMDYDILLTTRIRENVLKGMSNDEAIHHAVTHTGSVITVCGLIMGGAFGTLMLSSLTIMQEIGFALCFAILCDALIVRTYIVPAIMHLLGNWNWKGPKFMQRKTL